MNGTHNGDVEMLDDIPSLEPKKSAKRVRETVEKPSQAKPVTKRPRDLNSKAEVADDVAEDSDASDDEAEAKAGISHGIDTTAAVDDDDWADVTTADDVKDEPADLSAFPVNPELQVENSRYAECGIIEKIQLQNFLNHANMEVSLGPNVNIIHGQNGSGKSAILVGLQTCFGVSAKNTDRGANMKQLIRHGSNWAKVIVTIKNEGADAFPGYQGSIQIERELKESGASEYRIKNAQGRVISRKKGDMVRILEHFNIQPSNPCAIMNQEVSKEFLQHSKTEDMYRFFLKASQLEQMRDQLTATKKTLSELDSIIKMKRDQLKDKRVELEEAKRLVEENLQLAKMTELEMELTNKKLWAGLITCEKELESARAATVKMHAKLAQLEAKFAEASDEAKLNEKLGMLHEKHSAAQRLLVAASEKAKGFVVEAKKIEAKAKKFKDKVAAEEKSLANVKNRLAAIVAESKRDTAGEDRRRQEEIDSKNEQLQTAKDELRAKEEVLAKMEAERGHGYEELQNCQRMLQNAKSRLREAQQRLEEVKGQKGDPMAVFGPYTRDILKDIDTAVARNQFHVRPLGPLGSLIKITEPKWLKAIEACLGMTTLHAYVTNDFHDEAVMRAILKKYENRDRFRSPATIVQRKSDKPYETYKLNFDHPNQPTIYSLLSIADPWAHNAVVDQSSCENWLAEPERSVAYDLVKQHTKSALKGCMTMDGAKIQAKGGSVSRIPPPFNVGRLLQPDNARALEEAKSAIPRAEAEVATIQRDFDTRSKESNKFKSSLKAAEAEVSKLQRTISNLENDVAALEAEIAAESKSADTDAVQAQLRAEIEDSTKTIQELKEQHRAVLEELKEVKRAEAEAKSEFEQAEAVVSDGQKEVDQLLTQQTTIKLQTQRYAQKIDAARAECAKLQQEENRQQILVDEGISMATNVCPRKDVKESEAQIDAQIKALKLRIAETTARIGMDASQARLLKLRLSNEVTQLETSLDHIQPNYDSVKLTLDQRRKEWAEFRKQMGMKAKSFFAYYLSKQGHSGTISFDHEKHSLQLEVTMHDHESQSRRTTSDARSLSGGERSFTTLSFIMALGEAIQIPIRAMDEFDVFMDSVNRRVSLNVLLQIASQNRNRQFIFLTPQDISGIPLNQHIKVHKLPDPERREVA